jgi:hypothetical protein
MKKQALTLLLFCAFLQSLTVLAQKQQASLTEADKNALEGVIVEKYYTAGPADYADTLGGVLPQGSVTYRIYIDLKPEYTLQMVYGNQKHELFLKTSSKFYNNTYCGAVIGYNVNTAKINKGNYSLDSWISLNSATKNYAGILRADDTDGSIIHKEGLSKSDGLTNGNLPWFKPFNLNLGFFDKADSAICFSTRNGGWAALDGVARAGIKGPTPDNRILVAQLTTNGELSFDLNIQVGTPSGGVVHFVAHNPEGEEVLFKELSFEMMHGKTTSMLK